jgi:hypothetical protein
VCLIRSITLESPRENYKITTSAAEAALNLQVLCRG